MKKEYKLTKVRASICYAASITKNPYGAEVEARNKCRSIPGGKRNDNCLLM